MQSSNNIFSDFVHLFYPNICQSCGNSLKSFETVICTYCYVHLPLTGFVNDASNSVFELFWGRTHIEFASAYLYFHKGNSVQTLMHRFKYKGIKPIGHKLGYLYGKEIVESSLYHDIDVIIPVPLHPKKLRQRGFNQSDLIAAGISEATNIPLDTSTLSRLLYSETQTRKSRFERWQNVKEIFSSENENLKNKHILLVDDTVTTGATLESCTNSLLQTEGVRVSVGAIAVASY